MKWNNTASSDYPGSFIIWTDKGSCGLWIDSPAYAVRGFRPLSYRAVSSYRSRRAAREKVMN
jgi:hypothetical protein